MVPPSQPVAASPPIPSSLFIANNPLLVVSTHINPLLVLVVSTRFKLLLVLLVLCAVALLLFHFTSLSSFVIIRQRLNSRPKQSVFQWNIFCRDLCFCNTTSTVKPLKPSKWAKHLQNRSRTVSSAQTSSDEGSYHHLWRAAGTLFILQRVVWWLHLKHVICFTLFTD